MVRVTPDNVAARIGYGLVLQSTGLVTKAKEQFQAGLRIDADNPVLLSSLAGLLVQTDPKHCEQAGPLLDRAFKVQPESLAKFVGAGELLRDERQEGKCGCVVSPRRGECTHARFQPVVFLGHDS